MVISKRDRFISKWRKEFGCNNDGLCWCDTCLKLGHLYDWFTTYIAEEVKFTILRDTRIKNKPGTIGWDSLPEFMKETA